MEKEVENKKAYIKGFNNGYMIYEYDQEVAKSLIENELVVIDDFSLGLKQGLIQAQQEKTLAELEQLRQQNNRDNELKR